MTLLFKHPIFLEHETGRHPENPNRLRSIVARLEKEALVQQCRTSSFTPYPAEKLTAVHEQGVVDRARAVAASGGGFLDADTILSPQSFAVALHAVGACTAAVDEVLRGGAQNALCLVRPPGHHATPDHSMGFCLFNNVALAARHAQKEHGVRRVLIVDWDVHHGNGTQDIFYEDPSVYFFSIHRYGRGFYPGTGAAQETGTGPGLGYTRNAPIAFGVSRQEYQAAFRHYLEMAADRSKPELVLLSAGFDAHARDPIGSLGLESEDFAAMTRAVLDVANVHAQGRLVSCLEGGYNLEALAEAVQAHLEELLAARG